MPPLFCCRPCQAQEQGDAMTKIPADAPREIWLQHDPDNTGEPFKLAHDVTWCADKINDNDIKYIRADLAKRKGKT